MDTSSECDSPTAIRVGILGTKGIPARYGGFETFAEELASRWSEDENFRITVVCPGPRRPDQAERIGRVRLEYVREPRLGPFTNVAFDLRCLWTHRRSFDILYMLGFGAAFACGVPRLWGTKVWLNMDGLEWKRSKWGGLTRAYVRLMERVSTWSATRIIADAEAVKAYFVETYGDVTCTFIPYGANLLEGAVFSAELLPSHVRAGAYLLVVARLEPENQIEEIIQGYLRSKLVKPLVIVGGTESASAYVKRLHRYRSERVKFVGGIYDKPRLAALRCHAHAYFHGHTVGGTNPSLLEALSAGQPIIAHDNPFNREVAGGIATFFTDPASIERILEEGRYLPSSVRDYVAACRARLRAKYTWEGVTDRYRDLARME